MIVVSDAGRRERSRLTRPDEFIEGTSSLSRFPACCEDRTTIRIMPGMTRLSDVVLGHQALQYIADPSSR